MATRFILRDANYHVENPFGGKNGQPVWCYYAFYAKQFVTREEAEQTAEAIRNNGWNIDVEEIEV